MRVNWRSRGVVALLLLAAVAGFAVFRLPLLWNLVTFALAVVGVYEWGRICAFNRRDCLLYAVAFCLFAGLVWWLEEAGDTAVRSAYLGFIGLFWIGIAPWWIAKNWGGAQSLSAALGILILYAVWLSAAWLYEHGDSILFAGLVLVWVFDTACYAVGRVAGRTPLAPAVSPKKTVEGLLGGIGAVFIGGAVYNYYFAEETISLAVTFPIIFSLAILAMLGDLFISVLKRYAGVKDSGRLFGNHGGVLDRMDSLLSVLPVVALLSPWLT